MSTVATQCVLGVFCQRHGFVHGAEAAELREQLGRLGLPEVQRVLDAVDARDALAYEEIRTRVNDGDLRVRWARGISQPDAVLGCLRIGAATVEELAAETGLPKNSIRAVLSTLTRNGSVTKRKVSMDGSYRIYELASPTTDQVSA